MSCLFELHEIGAPAKNQMYASVDFLSSVLAYDKSTNPSRPFKGSFLNGIPKFIVPVRYYNKTLYATILSFLGCALRRYSLDTVAIISGRILIKS